jgi:hypothetical protein
VLLFHLNKQGPHNTGLLSPFKKIYVVGDHGMHFSSKSSFWFHSTWFKDFAKEVIDLFLCSYHAYSLADGVGAQGTREGERLKKDGKGPEHAVELASAINKACPNIYAFALPQIARDPSFYPQELDRESDIHNLRKACVVSYVYMTKDGKPECTPGVCLFKVSVLDPLWTLYDLLPASRETPMCWFCSNSLQRPLWATNHTDDPSCVAHNLPARHNRTELLNILPDHNRFGVLNAQRAPQTKAKKTKDKDDDALVFPCKDASCSKSYKTPGGGEQASCDGPSWCRLGSVRCRIIQDSAET